MSISTLHLGRVLGMGVLALVLAGGVAGCSNTSSDDAARIAELEQQVAELKGDKGSANVSSGSKAQDGTGAAAPADKSDVANSSASASATTLDEEVKAAYPELADFEARVAEAEASCEAVQRTDDMSANYQAFLDQKTVLDAIEREMDAFDDAREYEAKTGNLAYERYLQVERAIDRLDDRLDYVKDGLEIKLGIDD